MASDNKRKAIEYIILAGLSFVTMLCLAFVSNYGITGIELLLPCVFALCMIVFVKAYGIWNTNKAGAKSSLKFAIPLGIVVDVCTVVGSKIDMEERIFNSFGVKDAAFMIVLIPFFICTFLLLFFSADAVSDRIKRNCVETVSFERTRKNIIKNTVINMAVMLVCWLPYYLTYFPGGIGNDIYESVNMCLGNIPWTNHHPVFFTAMINMFIKIFAGNGNLSLALGMMVLTQMIILAAVLSLIIVWLQCHNASRIVRWISLAFFSIHPIMAMYSIYLTKDVIFSCIVALLVLFLGDYVKAARESRTKIQHHIALGILSLLAIITRNNGTLVVLITAVVLLVTLKNSRKQVLLVLLTVLVINSLYKGPVWKAVGVEKQSFAESAAIPLTQIAYTIYTDGEFSEDDRAYLEELMPFEAVKDNFLPGYVDTYKFDSEFNTKLLDSDPKHFMLVWLHGLTKNFGKYVEAYLFETCGYWSYGISNTVATEGVVDNDLGISGNDILGKVLPVSLTKIIPELILIARKLPLLCILSQMAAEILAVFVLACRYIKDGKKYSVIMLVPLIAVWISVMIASPAYCLFRYMFPVFMLWPVLIKEFLFNNDK